MKDVAYTGYVSISGALYREFSESVRATGGLGPMATIDRLINRELDRLEVRSPAQIGIVVSRELAERLEDAAELGGWSSPQVLFEHAITATLGTSERDD